MNMGKTIERTADGTIGWINRLKEICKKGLVWMIWFICKPLDKIIPPKAYIPRKDKN